MICCTGNDSSAGPSQASQGEGKGNANKYLKSNHNTSQKTFHMTLSCTYIGSHPLSWTDQLKEVTVNPFDQNMGPTVDVPNTPSDMFQVFFNEDLQEQIVVESNRYTKQVMGEEV